MKKAKNIVLLIGIICNLLYILLQIFKFVYHCITILPPINLKYFIIGDFVPILITIAILILPVILLIRNLKNKTGKVLPIISAMMCGVVSLLILFSLLTPAIPQYLIYSKLGLIDTYLTIILSFITNGGILVLAGFVLLIVGSVMSTFKPKVE
ncbi:MAG: hypothetical protein IKV81_01485 [Clostridia bacterium]|nr:hypothetical protein [Clostridia bacterium]